MTLPFESESDRGKRKYQCFVCGVMFTEFAEFTEHILEKHEEGSDYVLCPLERCKTPVRDVPLHFKVYHKSEKIPQKGMMRATVWRDISPKGNIKRKKNKFREGYFESTKMQKTFHYDSGWEATVFELLDSWHEVIAYEKEPFKIPYIHEGQCHNYLPDLFIAFLDGRKEIWEVKPSSQTAMQKNQDKWFAARKACEARGWGFEVITEIMIEKLKKTVKNQHLDYSSEEPEEEYIED